MEKAKDLQPEHAKPIMGESPGVDLSVMLDCTGSMGSYISMCRNKIKDIIAEVKETYPQSEIRISIVAYRDIKDDKRFEVLSFTQSSDSAKKFLDILQAYGGGDTPEDVNGAFQKALFAIEWENPVRLLVHVADAPCHGKKFHKCDDDFPQGHKDDLQWEKIFKKLVELRIDYLFLKVLDTTDQMFLLFKEIAQKQGSETNELSFQQELVSDSGSKAQKDGKKVGHEEHFAAKICEKVKSCVDKELKKGFKKKLEKRTTENANLVENVKKSIAKIIEKYDFEALKKKYGDLSSKIGECILSSNNFIEALADEDCLCLTFDIGRSQAAIVDPSQVIIKDVFPSFLTAGSFFYSTEFALKKNKLAHGGYEKNADGLIIKGAAQENITGVMPLYLCEENWPVAKQLMKMTMAWAVTLEPSGYVYTQIKIVPFLLFAKIAQMLHEKPDSEFLLFQFELVKKTCVQIMKDGSQKDFSNKFDQEVIDLYSKYVENPGLRTIDSIANNTMFLAQLYIAKECGFPLPEGEKYFEIFLKAVLEEEIRRKLYPLDEVINQNQWILDLLNVDFQTLIEDPVEKFKNANKKESNPIYEQAFLEKIGECKTKEETETEKVLYEEKKYEEIKYEEYKEEKPKKNIIYKDYDFKRGNDIYTIAQQKAIDDHNHILKKVVEYFYPLIKIIRGKEVESPTNFFSWGIDTDTKFFTLYIQNKLQTKNADRREAFVEKRYMNPWIQDREYIQYWYNKSIEDEKKIRINTVIANMKSMHSNKKASIFAYSDNLNEAAGALMGTRIGDGTIRAFHLELCQGKALFIRDKVMMLTSGHYKGVRLYTDLVYWNIGRKKGNSLCRAYPSEKGSLCSFLNHLVI